MGWAWGEFAWCVGCLIPAMVFLLRRHRQKSSSYRRLPPGPPGWPLFGNMFDLGATPHVTLAGLKQKYGPVIWLRIGAINTMVVQSATAAADLFKNHDIAFAERMVTEAMKAHDFDKGSVALAPYGSYWRVMKRVITVEMLVNKKINDTAPVRRRCIDDMLSWIAKEADALRGSSSSQGIHLARFVFLTSFNMLGNLMLSRDLVDPESEEGTEFFTAMVSLMEWAGHPNIVDLFPWLRRIDPQGLRRKANRDMGKTMRIVSKYVKERIKERLQGGQRKKDLLEVLLEFEGNGKDEPAKISDHELTIIVMEVFLAGSETTSGTTEWAMVELLSNPSIMSKLKDEMNEVIGQHRKVEESDIDNLKYLQAVVKETLRLHPPIPFLVPRRATQDTNFMGYDIPKNTQVFVNVSAIGRDPESWDDPECFQPDRFLGSSVDFKGNHFELIPFGAGRRICAGIPLAHRMLHLVLASLAHEFDWSVHSSVANCLRDTKERMGIVVRKIEPLVAIPTPKVKNRS